MTIESRFDIPLIAGLALKEKQIQQHYRPIIAVHKWFARRPGSLFRGLALAEFGDAPLSDLYFHANDFPGRKVADPFMGGGIPLIEANRIGCDVYGFDINPMSAWIVREEIEHLDMDAYEQEAARLLKTLRAEIEDLYHTDCLSLPFISSAVETLEFCIPTGYLFRHAQDHQHAHLRLPRNRPWPRSASHRNPCPATAGSCPETEKAPAIASEGG